MELSKFEQDYLTKLLVGFQTWISFVRVLSKRVAEVDIIHVELNILGKSSLEHITSKNLLLVRPDQILEGRH